MMGHGGEEQTAMPPRVREWGYGKRKASRHAPVRERMGERQAENEPLCPGTRKNEGIARGE